MKIESISRGTYICVFFFLLILAALTAVFGIVNLYASETDRVKAENGVNRTKSLNTVQPQISGAVDLNVLDKKMEPNNNSRMVHKNSLNPSSRLSYGLAVKGKQVPNKKELKLLKKSKLAALMKNASKNANGKGPQIEIKHIVVDSNSMSSNCPIMKVPQR